ncbi:MAG: hypothetical protein P4L77_11480 [Sulfuriferula sp.]|nr:hypothetical protein [Sulfuriferula sp.]
MNQPAEDGSIKYEIDNDNMEEMGQALFHLVRGLYKKTLAPWQEFRAAALRGSASPVTGAWRYTQIYISDSNEDFNLTPARAIIVSENPQNETLTLTYVINDEDHVTYPPQWTSYYDYHKFVAEIAVFLVKGRSFQEEKELEARQGNVIELFG